MESEAYQILFKYTQFDYQVGREGQSEWTTPFQILANLSLFIKFNKIYKMILWREKKP